MNERRILIADDDSMIRRMTWSQIGRLCKSMGVSADIHEASTGKGAVEMARATEYHLAVLDNSMESINNGYRAILDIREFRPELPLILYTSSIDPDKEVALRNVGAEVVIKNGPVELEDVARKYLEARE